MATVETLREVVEWIGKKDEFIQRRYKDVFPRNELECAQFVRDGMRRLYDSIGDCTSHIHATFCNFDFHVPESGGYGGLCQTPESDARRENYMKSRASTDPKLSELMDRVDGLPPESKDYSIGDAQDELINLNREVGAHLKTISLRTAELENKSIQIYKDYEKERNRMVEWLPDYVKKIFEEVRDATERYDVGDDLMVTVCGGFLAFYEEIKGE